MKPATSLHHIAIGVLGGLKTCELLTKSFGFALVATRRNSRESQWVLKSGDIVILLTEMTHSGSLTDSQQHWHSNESPSANLASRWYLQRSSVDEKYAVESVYDVCLLVKNVSQVLNKIVMNGATVLTSETTVKDDLGFVEYAVVKSCVGNVVHTLLNTDAYEGSFLPGFTSVEQEHEQENVVFNSIDHVAFAVDKGRTPDVLDWYEKCLGMKRFLMNRMDTEENGCIIDSVKLKLCTMDYWKCAETNLQLEGTRLKFVIGETLDTTVTNQVKLFLEQHGGPGVQHLAFSTEDIVAAARKLRGSGIPLVKPPHVYYTDPAKRKEITSLGESIEELEDAGILLDNEADIASGGYLMQVFTEQIFERNTFFLELILRRGATGFGVGNITSLFKAMQACLDASSAKSANSTVEPGVSSAVGTSMLM